jgi:F0F1-type ATP synthase delta subunit
MSSTFTFRYSAFIGLALFASACGSSSEENIAGDATNTTAVAEKDNKAQNVFYSIPSPIETTSLLKGAGAKYNASYLNPIENVANYSTAAARALNLGVYGTDLSFTSIFDQTQESMLYLRCTNKLATSLGISGAFDEKTTSRIEANLENRDSLLTIISDSYWNADSYLKENGQPGVSALIIAGGWVEGLYIATQIANNTKNEDIATRIGEQKLSLDNLVALLDSYKTTNTGVEDTYKQLAELKTIYDAIPAKSAETVASTDPKAGVTTVDNKSSYKLTPEQLKAISDKAAQIRNKIIK